MKQILISTGDHSADMHGESLARELKALDPSVKILALGGGRLKSVADDFLHDMVELDVSGFTQPFKKFFKLKSILTEKIFPKLSSKSVSAIILIDYYGFNIHVAEKAHKEGIPVFYFVSPQVWASRKWRIQRLKANVTRMLVIFPFEEELYKKHGVPVNFVGHPLMDALPEIPPHAASSDGKIRLGLMPGSRNRELLPHIPLMVRSVLELRRRFPSLECSLLAVDAIPDSTYESLIRPCLNGKSGPEPILKIVRGASYAQRSALDLCITASGTATLENALLGIPMVVVYQTSWLTYWIAKKIIQVPYISMPNILSGREVVPELIQGRATPELVAETAARFIEDPDLLARMRGELIQLKKKLGPPGAYRRAADIILSSL